MLKHVGRMAKSKRKIVVAYRVVPGEPDNAIVVTTENLLAEEHDALINLVNSAAGQQSEELATIMARTPLPDGRNMLEAFHKTGKLVKVATDLVEMIPTAKASIMLDELNRLIADQKGVTVEDLAVAGAKKKATPEKVIDKVIPADVDTVLTDEQLATQYRSQAAALFKEAKLLREQADELVPAKKTIPAKKATLVKKAATAKKAAKTVASEG